MLGLEPLAGEISRARDGQVLPVAEAADADRAAWVAVGDKGVRVTSDAAAHDWQAGRISEKDLSWRTQIVKVKDDFVLAGANLAVLHKDELRILGRD